MKKEFFLLAGLALSAVACQERIQPEEPDRPVLTSPLEGAVEGKIRIKVTDELKREFESLTDEEGNVMIAGVKSVDNALADMNVISVSRVFKSDPRFVKRERESGIDKWYEIVFDENQPLTRAAESVVDIDGVEYAEYVYNVVNTSVPVYSFAVEPPFDDPYSKENYQWHYQNNGNNGGNLVGSDINLYNAYNRFGITGSPNVIVAVVDGGIQYDHPDLAQNMWVNEAELNGQPGVDDDGNGYVDDIYGYNFYYSGEVTPHDHGTHVAGTVGAVNNNGIGVVGVAGGNGSPDSGVRLMSCQIFDSKNEKGSGNSERALKYGADNGAVIAQNSWGHNKENAYYLSQSTKDAINYFIKYAGKDADGNQVGPMDGGVVIFAAGNDNMEMASPAFYEPVLAVAAIGADYERAYYSNYGDWVDITAPGGDAYKNRQVYSTLPNGRYGNMQGTSMACPHVSGIAALVVSALGGPGFTADRLKEILLNACDPDSLYKYNPKMEGMLGRGLINTEWALSSLSTIPPERISEFDVEEPTSNSININVGVPSDEDDGYATSIYLYYSKESFSSVDYDNVPSNITELSYKVSELENVGGDEMTKHIELSGLDFETGYYVAVAASDRAGNMSELSQVVNVTTGTNHAPVIEISPEDENVIIKTHETRILHIAVSDPDGHSFESEVSCELGALSSEMQNGTLVITINGWEFSQKTYTANIVVTDEYDMSATASFNFTIQENKAPEIVGEFPGVCINGLNQSTRINMNDYISDPDGEPLNFTFEVASESIASVVQTAGYFDIKSLAYGSTEVFVTASDAVGKSVELTFTVLVREGDTMADIYPNPVYKDLYIRPGVEGTYKIVVSNTAGGVLYNDVTEASPFSPLLINMVDQPVGVYNITIVSQEDGTEYKSSVVKY